MKRPLFNQQGLSIVELMIAITLGLIITAGLVQIFSGNQRSFAVGEANMRVQETGRMASEFLSRAVRNADYWGCIPRENVANKLDNTSSAYVEELFDFSDGFMAFESDGSGIGLDKTDVMVLRGVGGAGDVAIEKEMPNSSANLKVNTVNGISVADILLISDCIAGDIFQVTGLQTGANPGINHNTGASVSPGNSRPRDGVDAVVNNNCPGNASNCLSKQYDETAQIFSPYYHRFFLDEDADGNRALYRQAGTNTPQEVVDGVWDLQLRVGLDSGLSNGVVTDWVEIDSPSALSQAAAANVVVVEMSLLARSPDDRIVTAPMELCFPHWSDCSGGPNFLVKDEVDANSRHLYRVVSARATIRNRILKVEQN